MPIGILRRLRRSATRPKRPCPLGFNAHRHSPSIATRLPLLLQQAIVRRFNAHRHSPSIATRTIRRDSDGSRWFQCPSAFSVDCDAEVGGRSLQVDHVSMPIGILRRLRPRRRSWPARPAHCFNAHRHSPSIATFSPAPSHPLEKSVSMPIGILRRLRRRGPPTATEHGGMFQCPSAFSVDCDRR